MVEVVIEYFTGSYKDGEKVVKLTCLKLPSESYIKDLDDKFGKENYYILGIEHEKAKIS